MRSFNSGAASLGITTNINDVQRSNYNGNSFEIKNVGNKKIANVVIDVSQALYPDAVFDPFGQAGDTTSKALTINTNGGTGVVNPSNASYIGAGGKKGYEAIQLTFNENRNGGFQPGETVGFSVDMDPNSVAGTQKRQLDGGTSPEWDVGGISGAELIGSKFTATFTDGSTATGQLQGDKSQAGAQALAAQDITDQSVSLQVNGLGAGGVGTYNNAPQVMINGAAGQTARIVLTKGFIQPFDPYADFLERQLDNLSGANFPANNAVEFQTADVKLTGKNQDITGLFNFSGVAKYNFAGEDKLPLGFVASIIDQGNNSLPQGAVTKPIYLQHSSTASNPVPNSTFSPSYDVEVAVTDSTNSIDKQLTNFGVADVNDTQTVGANKDNVIEPLPKPQPPINNSNASIRIEAEDGDNILNYRVEENGVASDNQVLSFVGQGKNETGSVTFNFTGQENSYDLKIGTFDEQDGAASFQVTHYDVETDRTSAIATFNLDRNLGSNLANSQTFISPTVASGIDLTPGDSITVIGLENASEHARLDYIELNSSDV